MKLLPSQDERDLASVLHALFLAECPTSLVRQLRDSEPRSMPDKLWTALAEAGVFGLLLPEEHGGAGGTLSDLGVFCVEAGRGLCPTVVHATLRRHSPSSCWVDRNSMPHGCLRCRPERFAPQHLCGAHTMPR